MMNITHNTPHQMNNLLPKAEADSPQRWEAKHSVKPIEALDQPEQLSRLSREIARSLDNASEAREATIQDLQDAIKTGTYRVANVQIADKMLRNMLLDVLP
jgi:anti-sigma28 factor (negative regulator of flagellin synthesis)